MCGEESLEEFNSKHSGWSWDCLPDEYYDEDQGACTECNHNCNNGCAAYHTCNLCYDLECVQCEDFTEDAHCYDCSGSGNAELISVTCECKTDAYRPADRDVHMCMPKPDVYLMELQDPRFSKHFPEVEENTTEHDFSFPEYNQPFVSNNYSMSSWIKLQDVTEMMSTDTEYSLWSIETDGKLTPRLAVLVSNGSLDLQA